MHRIEQLRETLFGFVDQDEDLVLVINARDLDMAIVLKAIESVDREAPADVFLSFAQPFESLDAYLDAVMLSLSTQLDAGSRMRVAEHGLEPWPELPLVCTDPRQDVGPRVHAAMTHVRGLFPTDEDHRMIWSFVPVELHDLAGYLHLVAALLPLHGCEPWMFNQRIILRDNREQPFLVPALARHSARGALVFDADFSPQAAADDLAAAAVDPETPEQQRMTALLQLAGLDLAYGRHVDAIHKYGIVNDYFERLGRPEFQAICTAGVADVLQQAQRLDEAKLRYQQALALASQAEVAGLGPTMIASGSLGKVCMARSEFEEAEGYFGIASQVAGALVNPPYKCEMMEQIGVARQARGDLAGAIEIWRLARDRCEEAHYLPGWRSVLGRLAQIYDATNMSIERQAVLDERARVDAQSHAERWPGC